MFNDRDAKKTNFSMYSGNSELILPVNPLQKEFEKAAIERDIEKANKLYLEAQKLKQEEINSKLETIEILPMFNKVILSKYPENPYKKVYEGGLLIDHSGNFLNPDSGEKDTLKELVACAKVIEVGQEVKYLRVGDDVYYDTRTVYPVPFMSMGYVLTSEPQILCVLNEGLKERVKNF